MNSESSALDFGSVAPCPTCAALVREQDMTEHQKWHAGEHPHRGATSHKA